MEVDTTLEAGGNAAQGDTLVGTDASSSLQTSQELDPFHLHSGYSLLPGGPGVDPATAVPAGGGNAPAGPGGGKGGIATAMAALIISTLPAPSDAHSLSTYSEIIDPYILVTLFGIWIVISYVFVAGVAYLLGRVSSPTKVHSMATLRPVPGPAVSDFPSPEAAIYTTRYGKLWHLTPDCELLGLSSQTLARDPCAACLRRTMQPRVDRVAETPPGSQ
jgi:hypothetical protein